MRLTIYSKINLVAAYYFIVGGLLAILALAILIGPPAAAMLDASAFLARLPGWFLAVGVLGAALAIGVVAAAFLAIGWGLWQLKRWSRMAAMVAAIFQIPFVPIGTLAAGAILYLFMQDRMREVFWTSQA